MSDKVISLFNKPVALDAIISLVFLGLYLLMVLKVSRRWLSLPEFRSGKDQPVTTVSIIVPFRNEKQNILNCLSALSRQNYPSGLFEIVPVDDHSCDGSSGLVEQFSKQCTSCSIKPMALTSEKGKKAALNMLPYLKLKLLIDAIGDPARVNFANVAGLQEAAIE